MERLGQLGDEEMAPVKDPSSNSAPTTIPSTTFDFLMIVQKLSYMPSEKVTASEDKQSIIFPVVMVV